MRFKLLKVFEIRSLSVLDVSEANRKELVEKSVTQDIKVFVDLLEEIKNTRDTMHFFKCLKNPKKEAKKAEDKAMVAKERLQKARERQEAICQERFYVNSFKEDIQKKEELTCKLDDAKKQLDWAEKEAYNAKDSQVTSAMEHLKMTLDDFNKIKNDERQASNRCKANSRRDANLSKEDMKLYIKVIPKLKKKYATAQASADKKMKEAVYWQLNQKACSSCKH